MPLKQLERFVTIRMTVVTVFVFATAFTAAIAIGLQYFFSRELASEAAADLYATTSSSVASELESIGKLNRNVVELLADNPELADPSLENKLLPLFTQVLERNPLTYGIYVGRRDGSLFEVINLDSSRKARDALDALHSDRWVVMRVDEVQGLRQRRYQYLDSTLRVRAERTEATDYDATKRPWYEAAIASGEAETSQPYLFAQLGAAGRTVSKRVINSESVVGLDLTLETMSAFLRQHEASRDSTIYLYDARGTVIASSKPVAAEAESDLPAPRISLSTAEREYLASLGTLKVSNETDWPPFDYAVQGQPRGYAIDMVRMIGESLDVPLDFVNGLSWPELVAQFRQGDIDILHPISLTAETRDWGLSGTPYLNLPFALLTRDQENPPKKLATLSGKRLAIPSGYVVADVIAEQWPEIKIVVAESPRDAVELVLNGEADAALDKYAMLQYISENYFISGVSIHSDIGTGMKDVPRDMYLLSPADEPELRTLIDRVISAIGSKQLDYLHTKWLDYSEAGSGRVAEVVPGQLTAIASNPVQQDRLVSGVIEGTDYLMYASKLGPEDGAPMVGIITPTSTVMAPFLEKVTYSIGITAGLLILLLPLSWVFADPIVRPIRQLARENDKVRQLRFDEVQRVPSRIKELDELSGSMVAMVASIQAHERAQRELMDAFIRLIAAAIDEKSAYTGGHCERVPELALMIAREATASNQPPFNDFRLDTEDQWREYRIAAWLHDCGKITTPEHIVDKGSKLETIYNRVHEVRMRFEVLWRDAEIQFLRDVRANASAEAELLQELEAERARLQEEFTFIAECNVGGEYLDPDKQQRLHEIATRTWVRHFDDRIGLSPVEELRLEGLPPSALPAQEPLLSDKPQHIIERTRSTEYPPEYEINMDIPEHLYNQGEIYNLSISRGTLTAEDRFKINEHMISTIKMLESLPFPPELANVPRWASTHHETMRGSGYPRKLPGDQLSIPERIMAVADVFEALTASDRPYKKAKPVSVAIDILHKMVEDEHIDRHCFELFLSSGVYREYAERYLDPSQVDEVDPAKYLENQEAA